MTVGCQCIYGTSKTRPKMPPSTAFGRNLVARHFCLPRQLVDFLFRISDEDCSKLRVLISCVIEYFVAEHHHDFHTAASSLRARVLMSVSCMVLCLYFSVWSEKGGRAASTDWLEKVSWFFCIQQTQY